MTLLSRKSPRKPMKKKSWMKKSSKPMPKRNPKRIAKRKVGYRKMLQSPEYKAARKEAMSRADGQCEYVERATGMIVRYDPKTWKPVEKPDGTLQTDPIDCPMRCSRVLDLHAHHLRYPKSRPLEATDLLIVCKYHHEYLESQKLHKTRMF